MFWQVCEILIRQIHIGTADLDVWLAAEALFWHCVYACANMTSSAWLPDGAHTLRQY